MIKKNTLLLCFNTEFWLNLGDEQDSTLLLHHGSTTLRLTLSLSSARSSDRFYLSFCDRNLLSSFFLLLCDRLHCGIDPLTVNPYTDSHPRHAVPLAGYQSGGTTPAPPVTRPR